MPIVPAETAPGASAYSNIVRKFARGALLAQGTPRVVGDWNNAVYDGWLEEEDTIVAVSDSAQDAPGGSGCQYLQWTGQGADGIEKTYFLTLNGTTPVESATLDPDVKFDVIYTAQCVNTEGYAGAGSLSPVVSPANDGKITITSKTTGQVMAIIQAGNGSTQMAIYRCPADHWATIHKLDVYPDSNQPVIAEIWGRDAKDLSWINFGPVDLDNDVASIDWPCGLEQYLSPGTDLCLVATPEQNNTNVSSQIWIKKHKIPRYEELVAEGIL